MNFDTVHILLCDIFFANYKNKLYNRNKKMNVSTKFKIQDQKQVCHEFPVNFRFVRNKGFNIHGKINTWNQPCWSSCHFGTMKRMILAWLCIRKRRCHLGNLEHQRSCWRMGKLEQGWLPSFHHCIRRCICRSRPWCSSWQSKLSWCLGRHVRIWRWRHRLEWPCHLNLWFIKNRSWF